MPLSRLHGSSKGKWTLMVLPRKNAVDPAIEEWRLTLCDIPAPNNDQPSSSSSSSSLLGEGAQAMGVSGGASAAGLAAGGGVASAVENAVYRGVDFASHFARHHNQPSAHLPNRPRNEPTN